MQKQEIIKKIILFLNRSIFCDLSTINLSNEPETRGMMNLHNFETFPHLRSKIKKENFETIYFTTNTHSLKTKQIEKNKNASVYYTNPETFEGILLIGEIEESKDKNLKDNFWDDSWQLYYPDGKDGGDYTLLKFTPKKYKFYDGKFGKYEGSL